MNFEFSEEQELLRAQAHRFLEAGGCRETVRAMLDDNQAYDATLWRGACDLGWPGVTIPEAYGGLGLGYLELCVIAEELGRTLAPIPFNSSIYLAAEAVLLAGSDAQQAAFLPLMATGEHIATLAITEGPGIASGFAANSVATETGGEWQLTGHKISVPDGMAADHAVVSASSPQGVGLFWVNLQVPEVDRSPEDSIDGSRPQADIRFEAVVAQKLEYGDSNVLQAVLERAAIPFAFEQIGVAQASLDLATAYALERKAFGRSIGSFQAVKHRLADMYAELELARSNAYFGAWALSTADESLPIAAATARLSASHAAFFCTKEATQIHGGMGFTWEADLHLYYRRARLLGQVIGGRYRWENRLVSRLEQQHVA